MDAAITLPRALLKRALADEVATLIGSWRRTTLSMLLGALILCVVLRDHVAPQAMALWIAAMLVNQAWRAALARAYVRACPGPEDAARWGMRSALGSVIAGSLWGGAAVAFYPDSAAHQALIIVSLFGVALGGLNLTAVYKPAFYGFVLPAVLPLIVRVGVGADGVHLSIAVVMSVVLAFVLAFGHQVNNLLTRSLVIRHENTDLIAELKARSEEAEAARLTAENANRAKSQFLAAASHDLRQPLHAMGLFAAALSLKAKEPEIKPLVTSINASVEALEGLFAQLLDLSRLEAGALQPHCTSLRLAPLFARVATDFAPQAGSSRLQLRVRPTGLAVVSDPVLLERVLRNLVSNALRYTQTGGVLLAARRRGAEVRIDVIDTGVGIAPDDRERVFDDFVQIHAKPRHHAGGRGMGLGLAIVRRLADLLQHRLELASRIGHGSRFSICLQQANDDLKVTDTPAPPAPAAPTAAATLAGCRVAAIDDDPAVIAAMRALFETRGGFVAAGENAERVRAALREARIPSVDLIVADLRLAEGVSGVDEVARLRSMLGAAIPALIVSGDTSEEARAEVGRAGLPLLAKPLVAATLEQAIATVRRRISRPGEAACRASSAAWPRPDPSWRSGSP